MHHNRNNTTNNKDVDSIEFKNMENQRVFNIFESIFKREKETKCYRKSLNVLTLGFIWLNVLIQNIQYIFILFLCDYYPRFFSVFFLNLSNVLIYFNSLKCLPVGGCCIQVPLPLILFKPTAPHLQCHSSSWCYSFPKGMLFC